MYPSTRALEDDAGVIFSNTWSTKHNHRVSMVGKSTSGTTSGDLRMGCWNPNWRKTRSEDDSE